MVHVIIKNFIKNVVLIKKTSQTFEKKSVFLIINVESNYLKKMNCL